MSKADGRLLQLAAVQGAGEDRKGAVRSGTVTADRSSQRSNVAKSSVSVSSSAAEQDRAVRKPFAVFDIDGTLIRWQLYHVLVDKLASAGMLGPDAKDRLRASRMHWKRREHSESFKEYERELIGLYEEALQNVSTEAFDKLVLAVIDEYKDQTYAYSRDLLRNLKKQGYILLIISGSHHELIEQIARYYGFDDWIGSRYERKGGGFSGKKQVASSDKRAALEAMVKKHSLSYKNSLAIGDSASDIPMLELVETPIAFNPDRILFEEARKKGWKVVIERKNMVYELEPKDGRYTL
jgi:HAD superfamily hydrolase (TIGR01490 family)